ncbi:MULTISPECIES: YqfQ family protein [Pontibacillus]|uniref:YqfQ family protein n=1 Tax=Pontibacillus chungwhensis TaxID=265426 RepID=A0ABY8UV51_9BACI|nr:MULTISPECIES: YqfQ family protein [Pontibacillus]MCD5322914.1 YqfQ family protein [Pontibacillus sp. HN14]WIF96310.1 YqfQ family protein [Pontibacillus chungwhensis]
MNQGMRSFGPGNIPQAGRMFNQGPRLPQMPQRFGPQGFQNPLPRNFTGFNGFGGMQGFPGMSNMGVQEVASQARGGGGLLSKLFSSGGGGGLPSLGGAAQGLAGTGGGATGMLNNVQQVLKMAQSAMPMVQEYGPMVRNIPTMFKLMKIMNEPDDGDETVESDDQQESDVTLNKENKTKKEPSSTVASHTSQKNSNKKEPISKPLSEGNGPSKPRMYI